MKKFFLVLILILGLGALSALSFLMGSDWGQGASWATGIYAILISIFLALQIYGFVHSQVSYSEAVEDAKYDLLKREGITSPLPRASLLPCLYCGVDSGPALQFFIWMIGGGLLAFLCLYGWGYLNGKFSHDQSAAHIPLRAEREEKNHV